jgi:ABC-type lipoprotein release transport system permease subunit
MTPVQETPQLFTLTLMLCVVASLVTCLIAAYRVIRGRRSSALRLVARWGAVRSSTW